MRIAIEALGIHYVGGGRSATLTLLEKLFELDCANEYLVFLTAVEPSLAQFPNVLQCIAPVRNRLLVRLWAELRLPQLLRRCDLVHFVKNMATWHVPVPSIVTVYDLTTLLYPQMFPKIDVWYWRYVQPRALQRANSIIAISAETAKDVQRFFQVPASKLHVIYPGYADIFRPATPAAQQAVREKYHLPEDFVLQVGRLDRKKKLGTLVRAYAILRQEYQYAGKLVLVGERYAKMQDPDMQRAIHETGIQSDIIVTGAVPSDDLPALYSSASLAVFLSWHEGFGIVALEAMACGVPLLATRAGAIPEATGGAADLIDAYASPAQVAAAMWQVLSSPERQGQLRSAGLQQSARFSNEQCARETLKIYQQITGQQHIASIPG